jgi:FtsP/CotA-like multicopper oxidase with cupredoxin domain
MTRKEFLSLATLVAGGAYPLSCSKIPEDTLSCGPGNLTLDIPSAAPKTTTTTRYPLKKINNWTSPTGLTLDCKIAQVDLANGSKKMSNAWTYNGEFPAPTIDLQNSISTPTKVSIAVKNSLAETTTTHWHGLVVDNANDGGPMNAITPGTTRNYSFPLIQRASLNWYHPHPHMNTGKQVNLGMAGLFIIRDSEEALLGLPSGQYEIPLIIRDATLDSTGNLVYKPTSTGFTGQIPLINGTLSPYLEVQPAVYRFRILNSANTRIFGLNVTGLAKGNVMKLIGNDGGLLPSMPYDQSSLVISPAERLDILIDFRGMTSNTKAYLKDSRSGWDLLEFRVSGTSDNNNYNIPAVNTKLSQIDPLLYPVTTRTFSFDGMTMINGKVYDMNRIDWSVPSGVVEKWVFKTGGNAPHPVHIHGASFQVISRTGGRAKIFPWELGWKDTVLLEDGETVEILIKFPGFTEYKKQLYLLHCHKLEHEDQGMMANFEVIY